MKKLPAILFLLFATLLFSCIRDQSKEEYLSENKNEIPDTSAAIDEQLSRELIKQKEKIRIFPEKGMMEATGITVNTIEKVLGSENYSSGPFPKKGIIVQQELKNIEEFQYLVVRGEKDDVVFLGDICDIFDGVTDQEIAHRSRKNGYFEFEKTKTGYRFVKN